MSTISDLLNTKVYTVLINKLLWNIYKSRNKTHALLTSDLLVNFEHFVWGKKSGKLSFFGCEVVFSRGNFDAVRFSRRLNGKLHMYIASYLNKAKNNNMAAHDWWKMTNDLFLWFVETGSVLQQFWMKISPVRTVQCKYSMFH